MVLQLKSKLRVYRKLKGEIGFEECLECVTSGTIGLFEELGRHVKEGGSQECPKCGTCKELVEHVFFECESCEFQRLTFCTM